MSSQDSRSQSTIQSATPRPAATVMLLRESATAVEVLVIRRHEQLAFMGGMWVFPGGSVSQADTSDESLARIPQRSQARCSQFADLTGAPLNRRECLGLTVAAFRETFEESGVLLATTPAGRDCGAELVTRLQEQRRAITTRPELFTQMLEAENLVLEIDRLVYWAHWITPSIVARRFDTRFFVAAVPAGQQAAIDSTETVDHAWMSPAALIEAAAGGKMPVSQPTLFNLMELRASLRGHGSLNDLIAGEAQRHIVPVLPKMIQEGPLTMVLPWDPFYRNVVGESVPEDLEYPLRLRELPSRMVQKR
jgi:8-oxo-dGTP pyrophosphatase MutT (NUDIX family)